MSAIISTEQSTITTDPLRRLLGIMAPVGPLAMAGWSLSVPYELADPPELLIPKMADSLRVELSFWMMLVFALTITVGVIVTGLVARRSSPRLGTAGMVLAFLGFAAMSYGGITYDALSAAPLRAGVDAETITAILREADTFTAPAVGGIVFIPMSFVGVILLGIAVWRGRSAPRWSAVLLIAAFPVILAGGAFLMVINALGFAMLAVAFGAAGRQFVASQ